MFEPQTRLVGQVKVCLLVGLIFLVGLLFMAHLLIIPSRMSEIILERDVKLNKKGNLFLITNFSDHYFYIKLTFLCSLLF